MFYAYVLTKSSQQPEAGANVTSPFSSDEETATQTGEGMWAGGTSGRWLAAGHGALALNQHVRDPVVTQWLSARILQPGGPRSKLPALPLTTCENWPFPPLSGRTYKKWG